MGGYRTFLELLAGVSGPNCVEIAGLTSMTFQTSELIAFLSGKGFTMLRGVQQSLNSYLLAHGKGDWLDISIYEREGDIGQFEILIDPVGASTSPVMVLLDSSNRRYVLSLGLECNRDGERIAGGMNGRRILTKSRFRTLKSRQDFDDCMAVPVLNTHPISIV